MTDATLGKNNKLLAYLKVHTTNQMEMRQKQVDIQDCSLDTAEKAMAPTPALLPGQSHGRRSPVGCGPWGRCESNTTEQLSLSRIGEGNGSPLQRSCLENPRDGGAWWAAVHGVAVSQTRLSNFIFLHWRRKWQPTPVFLPGESQGWGSLVGCRLWGLRKSDTTDAT